MRDSFFMVQPAIQYDGKNAEEVLTLVGVLSVEGRSHKPKVKSEKDAVLIVEYLELPDYARVDPITINVGDWVFYNPFGNTPPSPVADSLISSPLYARLSNIKNANPTNQETTTTKVAPR